MKAPQQRPAASAAALLVALGAGLGSSLGATSAQAAVTAQDVWDQAKAGLDLSAEGGVTIGAESNAGGVLTVTDLAIDTTGEDGVRFVMTIPQITFTENGDGTVAVATTETVPMTITSPGDPSQGTPTTEVALSFVQTGMTTTVSGDPGALSYDVAADSYAVELGGVTQDGAAVPAEGRLAVNGVAGTYTTTGPADEARSMGYDLAAASIDLVLDLPQGADGGAVSVTGEVSDVAFDGAFEVPASASTSPETALADGLSGTGSYGTGASRYDFEVADAAGPISGTVSSEGSDVSFQIAADAVGYDVAARGLAVEAAGAQLPFPISASVAEYGVNVLVPAAAGDAPSPWAFGLNLTDLVINEEVWALFDPGAALARDPATVIVDLSGTATLFMDLFDPSSQAQMETGAVPGELNSITLNDLNVSVGGAQVTGTGEFTIDNGDTTTFSGIPKPVGAADFQLNGVNALIDDLVAAGLVPQEQVMGARMFLGLLAVPVGDDQLTSRIEVTEDGQLLANGQRLQ